MQSVVAPSLLQTTPETLTATPETADTATKPDDETITESPDKEVAEKLTEESREKLSLRLPKALKPLHYLVKLQPFINGNFSILGYVEVEIQVLESTSNITLHMADIITNNDTVRVGIPV